MAFIRAPGRPQPILLWSTSNAIKHRLSRDYVRSHYVWCSEAFEGETRGRYTAGGTPAPSSDPAHIYRRLHAEACGTDRHSDAIDRQKESLIGLAIKLRGDGVIEAAQAAEMVAIVDKTQVSDWRPLIYAIPYAAVAAKIQNVPVQKWAGLEPEFIIPDLLDHEFHVIEPMQCR